MSCLPGMPCYNSPVVKIVYPPGCDPTPHEVVSSDAVRYDGPNLPCTGVQNGDDLTTALEKIDTKICSEELVASIIQTISENEVLKAYFCELVSSCGPTTTTTTTQQVNYYYSVSSSSEVCSGGGTGIYYPGVIDCNTATLTNESGVLTTLPSIIYLGLIGGNNTVQFIRIEGETIEYHRISGCIPCSTTTTTTILV